MFFSMRKDHLPNKPHICHLSMTKTLSVTPRFESLSDYACPRRNLKPCWSGQLIISKIAAICLLLLVFWSLNIITVSDKMKTKPPRFYVLASAAIARQRRTQCVVVLKSGGQFPDTLSAQELLPGWQMGGCHWSSFVGALFVAFVCCILCCWFAVDCQRETHFIFCFCAIS